MHLCVRVHAEGVVIVCSKGWIQCLGNKTIFNKLTIFIISITTLWGSLIFISIYLISINFTFCHFKTKKGIHPSRKPRSNAKTGFWFFGLRFYAQVWSLIQMQQLTCQTPVWLSSSLSKRQTCSWRPYFKWLAPRTRDVEVSPLSTW